MSCADGGRECWEKPVNLDDDIPGHSDGHQEAGAERNLKKRNTSQVLSVSLVEPSMGLPALTATACLKEPGGVVWLKPGTLTKDAVSPFLKISRQFEEQTSPAFMKQEYRFSGKQLVITLFVVLTVYKLQVFSQSI